MSQPALVPEKPDHTDVPLKPGQMALIRDFESGVEAAKRALDAAVAVRDGAIAVALEGVDITAATVTLLGFDFEANTVRVKLPPQPE